MSRKRGSPEVRKSESPEEELKAERPKPKASQKSKVVIPIAIGTKSEEENASGTHSEKIEPLTTHNSLLTSMEVHHHPEVEKKGFKEYILEGLMIFLAVTMGFFAESLREHIANHEKETQYVISMINDLKDNKGKLEVHIKQEKESRDMVDSLITILNNPDNIPQRSNELYYFGRRGPRFPTLLINMRTYEQLKNSGNFRLISNMEVSNEIMAYYENVPYMRQLEDLYTEEFSSYKKVAAQVFEPAILRRLEGDAGTVIRSTDNPPLQKNAGGFIKELAVDAVYMNASRKQIIVNDEELLKSADQLLNALQNAYHLEDE
jgi:hypothetical protein